MPLGEGVGMNYPLNMFKIKILFGWGAGLKVKLSLLTAAPKGLGRSLQAKPFPDFKAG